MVLANFQLLLIRIIVGQGPTMLAVGAVGVVGIIFSFRLSMISFLFLPVSGRRLDI